MIVSALLIGLDRREALTPLRDGLASIVVPIERVFATVANGPNYESDIERALKQAESERDAQMAENANLKARIAEYEVLDEEGRVEALRPELDFVAAEVLGGDPKNLQEFITIDKGEKDGIDIGMAVTDPDYFVGQVVEVEANTAKIMLIIDSSAQVGAQLVDSRADGIVIGQWQIGGRLLIENVDLDADVADGEVVATSGATTTETRGVPPNLVIGTIEGEAIDTGRTNEVAYEVRPQVDFHELDTVWVVMPGDDNSE